MCALIVVCALASVFPRAAGAEQASEPTVAAAGELDVGAFHTCGLLAGGSVRCWGFGGDGQLGYGNTNTVGDDETPAAAGPLDLAGHTVKAISAGAFHTCGLLEDNKVRCWGSSRNGQLGYGNTKSVGDDESPGSVVAPVDLGGAAKAISAGDMHTCAVREDDKVLCWGFAGDRALGYESQIPNDNVGDNETPASVGPVNLGAGHTAKAITAGGSHTCAILDDDTVRCWGFGANGQLGYGKTDGVVSPGLVGPVYLGKDRAGRPLTAKAISAGQNHTCALLDDGQVRCWGYGADGELGYASTDNVGDDETPGSVAPVDLGAGRTAVAVSAADNHTCALLDDGQVRCWGLGASGRLGYGNTSNIGDNEAPGSVGPVPLGLGHTAVAVSAGGRNTCARLEDGNVRCWGFAGNGRLGYCNQDSIGDNETPASAGPVDLGPGYGGVSCVGPPGGGSPSAGSPTVPAKSKGKVPAGLSDAARARSLRRCLARVARDTKREGKRSRRGSARQHAKARRQLSRQAGRGRGRCLRLYGRTPGAVTGLRARALGRTQIEVAFNAPGTDGSHPPPARSYQIKQALRPIQDARDFTRAQTLCKGSCRFTVSEVGGQVTLTVTDLAPHTTYYYAVAARDNVSARRGSRSRPVKARTR